jgi:hypothetical protein
MSAQLAVFVVHTETSSSGKRGEIGEMYLGVQEKRNGGTWRVEGLGWTVDVSEPPCDQSPHLKVGVTAPSWGWVRTQ